MLSKGRKLNLRQHPEFFTLAKRKHYPYFSFFYIRGDETFGANKTKLTVVVPKKVSLKSSKRNYFRRQVYQQISNNWHKFENANILGAIIVKPEVSKVDKKGFEEQIAGFLGKVGNL